MIAESSKQGGATSPQRLAIIGGGSSGLIALKNAIDALPHWEIVCFEKSNSIIGCWGNPYPGFVSTSTRYTTQFACFPICDASVNDDGGSSKSEFFCDDEYGKYLEAFAERFGLGKHIRLNTCVKHLERLATEQWRLSLTGDSNTSEDFDAVVICTGVAATPKEVACDVPVLSVKELNRPTGVGHITGQKIVVIGGGESAVDYADRLAKTDLNNEVYLSLSRGVRVSPRYHPIRGVPSDFLRNRLMLSVHPDIRNRLGQIFVEARIRYERIFKRVFPSGKSAFAGRARGREILDAEQALRRKDWTLNLTLAAKDDVFNMYHNKSDDFLIAVGEERIKIIGPPVDQAYRRFRGFGESWEDEIEVDPDSIVPAIGYRSKLEEMADLDIDLRDFYLACCHVRHDNLYLVGFARPIIGNIPTISEMQARWICGLISGDSQRPEEIEITNQEDRRRRSVRYAQIDLEHSFPVEMFEYCDQLAAMMGQLPAPPMFVSPLKWWRTMVSPASTLHYVESQNKEVFERKSQPRERYMPAALVLFILCLKPFDWAYRFWKGSAVT